MNQKAEDNEQLITVPKASFAAKTTLTVLIGTIPMAILGWVHTAERLTTVEVNEQNSKETFQTGLKDLKESVNTSLNDIKSEHHADLLAVQASLNSLQLGRYKDEGRK
jgi:hypothetical protein